MIIVPFINPLRYKEQGFLSGYQTKYFDNHLFQDTIRKFEEHVEYYQPWQTNDKINQQLFSDSASMSIEYINEESGEVALSANFTQVSSTVIDGTTVFVYEHKQSLSLLPSGNYYTVVDDGSWILESNRFNICSNQPATVYIKYSNPKFYEDVIWEFGIEMFIRVQGFVNHDLPKRSGSTYEDQVLDMTRLKSVSYNTWTFITDSYGVPSYMIDILNRVFGCKSLRIDGKYFTIPEGNEWEEKEQELYPMRGWGIDMREATNVFSRSFKTGARLLEDGFHRLLEDDSLKLLEG